MIFIGRIVEPHPQRMHGNPNPIPAPKHAQSEAACAATREADALSLAGRTYENFSVLSWILPAKFRPDFASVYAFCRTADDLSDEQGAGPGARARALAMLRSFRCLLLNASPNSGAPRLPAAAHGLIAPLKETIRRRALPIVLFTDLLDAFEQDQVVDRYNSWEEVVSYSTRSANPVGRLVLHICEPALVAENPDALLRSDDICTALQLANFWQDVRRDLLERDRIYLPLRECGLREWQLREWLGRPAEPTPRSVYAKSLAPLVRRTRRMFSRGEELLSLLRPETRPVIRAFLGGGVRVLDNIEQGGFCTLWKRPRVSSLAKAGILLRAGRPLPKPQIGQTQ